MARYHMCRECGGTGRTECWACHGDGAHPVKKNAEAGEPCPECLGDKHVVCLDCDGAGGWYNQ